MADDEEQEDRRDQDGDDGEGQRIATLEAISRRIDELAAKVERALGGTAARGHARQDGGGDGGPQTQRESADARRTEIREELASLRSQEREAADREDMATRLKAVERKFEKPPRELRRVEKIMGWHRE